MADEKGGSGLILPAGPLSNKQGLQALQEKGIVKAGRGGR